MIYNRRLVQFPKKLGTKTIQILKIIRNDCNLGNKCGIPLFVAETIWETLKILWDASSLPNHTSLIHHNALMRFAMVWYRMITRRFKICVVSVWIDYSLEGRTFLTQKTLFRQNFHAEKLCIVSLVNNITSRMRSRNFGIKFLTSWMSISFRISFMILVQSSWPCIFWKTLLLPGFPIFATKLFLSSKTW